MVHRAISTGGGAAIRSWAACAGVARVTAPKLSGTTGRTNSAWNAEATSLYWSSPLLGWSDWWASHHRRLRGGFRSGGRPTATSPPCSICPVARETLSRLYRGLWSETSVSMRQCGTERRQRREQRPPGPVSQAKHAERGCQIRSTRGPQRFSGKHVGWMWKCVCVCVGDRGRGWSVGGLNVFFCKITIC